MFGLKLEIFNYFRRYYHHNDDGGGGDGASHHYNKLQLIEHFDTLKHIHPSLLFDFISSE